MASTTATFDITGMHCGSCAGLIDDELADLEGVETSETSADDHISAVTYDDAATSAAEIAAAIADAGDYSAALRSE